MANANPTHQPGTAAVLVLLAMILVLAACETIGTTPGGAEYNIFFSPGDHVERLLADGELDEASRVYVDQRDYFNDESKARRAIAGKLWIALGETFTPRIKAARQELETLPWPVGPDKWRATSDVLAGVTDLVGRVEAHGIVKEERFPYPSLAALKDVLDAARESVRSGAGDQFLEYPITTASNFFDAYPVELDAAAFLADSAPPLGERLEGATRDELIHVFETYREHLSSAVAEAIGASYFAVARRDRGDSDPQSLKNVLAVVKETRAAGLPLKEVPGISLAMIEVTSRTLLREGQIEFPVSVEVDLPFRFEKAELDAVFAGDQAGSADHLVVIDVALAKAERRVLGIKKMPSTVLLRYRTDPNPDYNMAQNTVNNARLAVQQASMSKMSIDSQFCQGLACLANAIGSLVAAARVSKAEEVLKEAMTTLNTTPMTIEVPIFADYKFDKAAVKATKSMTVNYYVIDRRRNKYFKSTFDVVEKETFGIAYSILDKDPKKEEHTRAYDTEKDVIAWEEEASSIKLSQLIQHYLDNEDQARDLPSLVVLRKEMLTDKNKSLARFEAEQFMARPITDPRLDHVVVIYTGEGGLGTGFFIKPDVVLTNWHVVDEAKFVEMKMHDGRETFGKVIAKDVRLDLALVKVQSRGIPVALYGNRQIQLGATVEALGHPQRLEFSITRGVVSAVRRRPGINLPGGGGKKVLYIQTDAPISPGNSGGPLFLGDKVIGVNTFATVIKGSQNLNFSVHHSEVAKFLEEYLPSYTAEGS